MRIRFLAFSEKGFLLAKSLGEAFGGSAERLAKGESLSDWTKNGFSEADALVFVGAVGIAVRAISPFVKHKSVDPAVVCVDELGKFSIPILSGHLGGANELARKIADKIGAVAVITTATDINGKFAVDEWARIQGFAIENPERIKLVSGKLLRGEKVLYESELEISGEPPEWIEKELGKIPDFYLGIKLPPENSLHVVPRVCALGIGCKKGTTKETIDEVFSRFLSENKISEKCIFAAASIDLKKNEDGLLSFCREHGLGISFYSAEELRKAEGNFSSSKFVFEITGVDNVCERSAVLLSGGTLIIKKYAANGVTLSLAEKQCEPDWRWKNE